MILWVISFNPGFIFSILAGVVCEGQVDAVPTGACTTDLGVFATLEEGGHANEANIVVPHDSILCLVARDSENVLKDCDWVKGSTTIRPAGRLDDWGGGRRLPSKLSRPVFSKKSFFPLL